MTYDKDVFGPLPKKKKAVFHHPMGFELYDALAMDLHAMTYAEQCVAAVCAQGAEAELLEALQNIAEYWNQDQNEAAMADACWHAIHTARAAIAKATGDQP